MNQTINLTIHQLKEILIMAGQQALALQEKKESPHKDSLSQREAYRQFGESNVRRWVNQNLITPSRMGKTKRSKLIYSRTKLLSIRSSEKILMISDTNKVNDILKK